MKIGWNFHYCEWSLNEYWLTMNESEQKIRWNLVNNCTIWNWAHCIVKHIVLNLSIISAVSIISME